MGLTRYRLGDLIENSDLRNKDRNNLYQAEDVKGISTSKEFIETKANLKNVSLNSYRVVDPEEFAYVADTSRRVIRFPWHLIDWGNSYCFFYLYCFRVREAEILNPYYLFMYFNRAEFDRISRFNSWGSARETFSWEDFCDIEIDLPPLAIQKKYVDVYKALLENQEAYETGLEDLKLLNDIFVDKLKNIREKIVIGNHLVQIDNRNRNKIDYPLMGLSMENYFIDTIANKKGLNISNYKIVKPGEYGCVLMKVGRDARLTIARNDSNIPYLISPAYFTFRTKDINSDYFMLAVNRTEFERRAWFSCDTSARGSLSWDEFCNLTIPKASESEQRTASKIHRVLLDRGAINEKLKQRLKNICPILIKGAVEEASRKEV